MTTPHLARAYDLRSKLDHVAEILRKRGWSVTVEAFGDTTIAATLMDVTFEGTPDAARQLCDDVERWARTYDMPLRGAVPICLPDDRRAANLRPGEQRVGFYALFPRSKAA